MSDVVIWNDPVPENCNLCNQTLGDKVMADCKIPIGPDMGRWGIICVTCIVLYQPRIGQIYHRDYSGERWEKLRDIQKKRTPGGGAKRIEKEEESFQSSINREPIL